MTFFLICNVYAISLVFASYEHHYHNKTKTRLHKLYLLPESQGKGMGKMLIDKNVALAKENQSVIVSLNAINSISRMFLYKNGF
jgi:GNAT superfamily N-acetyltransferase